MGTLGGTEAIALLTAAADSAQGSEREPEKPTTDAEDRTRDISDTITTTLIVPRYTAEKH